MKAFSNFLSTKKLDTLKIVQIPEKVLPSDLLDRIYDTEIFTDMTANNDGIGEKLYCTANLKEILTNKEDDTNESTKSLIDLLYEKIKKFDYFMVTK